MVQTITVSFQELKILKFDIKYPIDYLQADAL